MIICAWAVVAWAGTASSTLADVKLPHIFGDGMVLQADAPIPVWGWADPGERVTVKMAGQEVGATADEKGAWRVRLAAMKVSGEPLEMTVESKNTLTFKDILIGEVWICSGQSNMHFPVSQVPNRQEVMAQISDPELRLLNVSRDNAIESPEPLPDMPASWEKSDAKSALYFSAVLYFFGKELRKNLNVPVGLIKASAGGGAIEPWINPQGYELLPPELAKKLLAGRARWIPQRFNGTIHPLVPYAIRGAIWYQGEGNPEKNGMDYHEKMKALIGGWRKVWGQGDFPFYFVQLAAHDTTRGDKHDPFMWPKLREAQAATLSVPNTGMAVTLDVGELDNIHPRNKQEVGRRLSLWALAKTYGRKDLVFSGPMFESMSVRGNSARISFDCLGGGLASRDGKPLSWFEIAGEDKEFVAAEAVIDGGTVVVRTPAVAKPVAVRFGFLDVAQPNLVNKEGLPAAPFRTDAW